jgi:adenylate cyclase
MTRASRVRARLGQLARVMLVVCLITPVFNVLTSEATLRAALQGLLDAVLITGLAGAFLLFVRDGWLRAWFRRLTFAADLALSGAIVVGLFLVGRAVGQVIMTGDPARFLRSFGDAHLLYALPFFVALAFAVQFLLQMNRMIGANVLRYYLAGAYHRPREEERIFLFLDDDATEAILDTQGEIYQYAGDEVVITWPFATGAREANCVRCFFALTETIARRAAGYVRDFDVAPRFRAGLHGGTVTGGELGDVRRQIVFVGDILNTAARLEEYAKRAGLDFVASGALLARLTLPRDVTATHCGELQLRGKRAPVTAYGLARAGSSTTRPS